MAEPVATRSEPTDLEVVQGAVCPRPAAVVDRVADRVTPWTDAFPPVLWLAFFAFVAIPSGIPLIGWLIVGMILGLLAILWGWRARQRIERLVRDGRLVEARLIHEHVVGELEVDGVTSWCLAPDVHRLPPPGGTWQVLLLSGTVEAVTFDQDGRAVMAVHGRVPPRLPVARVVRGASAPVTGSAAGRPGSPS